jgi:hypothetical protein
MRMRPAPSTWTVYSSYSNERLRVATSAGGPLKKASSASGST